MQAKPFDVATVPLTGSNLIEASAGTGKTYSIAILALRLVLEGKGINKLLLVTFTRAAVEELETRIRLFMRQAEQCSKGQRISDSLIESIVRSYQNNPAIGADEVTNRLSAAVRLLDEASILTIHAFCQRVLSEYAVETGEPFGSESITPEAEAEVLEDAANRWWRKWITNLPEDVLTLLLDGGLNRSALNNAIQLHKGGKPIIASFAWSDTQQIEDLHTQMRTAFHTRQEAETTITAFFDQNREEAIRRGKTNGIAAKGIARWLEEGQTGKEVWDSLRAKEKLPNYFFKLYPELSDAVVTYQEADNLSSSSCNQYIQLIYAEASAWVITQFEAHKRSHSLISFDDMIKRLHRAVVEQESALHHYLRRDYEAVFIDEFQDTDRAQYEIYERLFAGGKSILFYIGDPKQSIYAFRQADIFTYLEARRSVDHVYTMNRNFRSVPALIHALNTFFLPHETFDTFHFGQQPQGDTIDYVPVQAAADDSKGRVCFEGIPIEPIQVWDAANTNEIAVATGQLILQLLTDPRYTLCIEGEHRAIRPADFGVLVRKKAQGDAIKSLLNLHQVPAVTINEETILSTQTAKDLRMVLEAAADVTVSRMRKALVTKLTGFRLDEVARMSEEDMLDRFRGYQQAWQKEGVYVMLMRFLTEYQVRLRLINREGGPDDQLLSQLGQLLELLHKMEQRRNYRPADLIHWLTKHIERASKLDDEFELRLEKDEAAVKIVTIHKSKGLEYPIVLAPHLDFTVGGKSKDAVVSFRHPDTGQYQSKLKPLLTDDERAWWHRESEQENRRLFYVALTRPRYACWIIRSMWYARQGSTLHTFIQNMSANAAEAGIRMNGAWEPLRLSPYQPPEERYPANYAEAAQFSLLNPHWRTWSYSQLSTSGHGTFIPQQGKLRDDAYDRFVYEELPRGTRFGNFLHDVLERVDFTDPSEWERQIKAGLVRHAGGNWSSYAPMLEQMLYALFHAQLPDGTGGSFSLSDVKRNERLSELEFYFPLNGNKLDTLRACSSEEYPFQFPPLPNEAWIQGLMNGKIDLCFAYSGKYYILDWKSNYLGNTEEAYAPAALHAAMAANNYFLQYHIYTVAWIKYLQLRQPDFDYARDFGGVIYLFVRGVRANESTGVFFHKPDELAIQHFSAALVADSADASVP